MANCFAIESPTYQPAERLISAITRAENAQVTTTFDHDYATGLVVRLVIAPQDGMQQIHRRTGTITVTSPTTFTITIDSRLFDPFSIVDTPHKNRCSQVVPVGEINSILTQATRNVL